MHYEQLERIEQALKHLLFKQECIMSALDDIKASVDNLTSAVSSAANEISVLAAAVTSANGNEAALEDLATKITAQADVLNAAVAAASPAPVSPPAS